jgi:NADH-quinone oxidoreductase subunit E
MLTSDEQREISLVLRHATGNAAASEALLIVQRARRWVSDETLAEVAAAIGLTAEALDSIATFYDKIYRRPVGRHVINICDSVSCHIMGYGPLRDHLRNTLGVELGQTTPDGRFTLLPTACLGACDRAPAMMVDDDLHTHLTAQKIDQVLARYE